MMKLTVLVLLFATAYGRFISEDQNGGDIRHTVDDEGELAIDNYFDTTNGLYYTDGAHARSHLRNKRQADLATHLALSHNDRNGNPRPVGRLHGAFDASGFYNRNSHDIGYRAGLAAVVHRSRNGRHSIGASVTGNGYRGSIQGYRYSSPRVFNNPRFGIGYRYQF